MDSIFVSCLTRLLFFSGVANSKRMVALGRKGGLVGGRARADALTPARRSVIARRAARARWAKTIMSTDSPADLWSFVAHCGSSVTAVPEGADLEAITLRAVRASRRDSALARMLPVFLWRVRHRLDLEKLVRAARRSTETAALGFFMEMARKLGRFRTFDADLALLRSSARSETPSYFFQGTDTRPFERMAADLATPDVARRWGLLMNMPWDSFASYFDKAARL